MNVWKVRFAIVVVFVAGILVGGLGTAALIRSRVLNIMREGPPPVHEIMGRRLTRDLDLTEAQSREVDRITSEYEPRFRSFFRRSREEGQAIHREMAGKIRELLDEGQRARYDENLREIEERFGRLERRVKGRSGHHRHGGENGRPGRGGSSAPGDSALSGERP